MRLLLEDQCTNPRREAIACSRNLSARILTATTKQKEYPENPVDPVKKIVEIWAKVASVPQSPREAIVCSKNSDA